MDDERLANIERRKTYDINAIKPTDWVARLLRKS